MNNRRMAGNLFDSNSRCNVTFEIEIQLLKSLNICILDDDTTFKITMLNRV